MTLTNSRVGRTVKGVARIIASSAATADDRKHRGRSRLVSGPVRHRRRCRGARAQFASVPRSGQAHFGAPSSRTRCKQFDEGLRQLRKA
jgi:hypothetical protein